MSTFPDSVKPVNIFNNTTEPVCDLKPIIDNSVIEGEFVFDNCNDIHIGPKYENSNNIIINQNISLPTEVITQNLQNVLKKEMLNPKSNCEVRNDSTYRHCLLLTSIAVATISLAVIMTVISFSFNKLDDGKPEAPSQSQVPPLVHSDDYPVELQFVLRESWGAAQPLTRLLNNTVPLKRVIFIHTVSDTCNKFRTCIQFVRSTQELHMDEDHQYGDIGYNFLVGSDGYIYVGVGWDLVGAHSYGFNTGSLGVAFIGDFRTDEPNEKMISSAIRLLEFGVKRKKLSDEYQLFGHCQIMSGFPLSPGKNILKIIKKWDHWNDTKIENCKG